MVMTTTSPFLPLDIRFLASFSEGIFNNEEEGSTGKTWCVCAGGCFLSRQSLQGLVRIDINANADE